MRKEYRFIFSFLIISSFLYIIISVFYSRYFPIIGTHSVAINANNILNFVGIKTLIVDDKIYLPGDTILDIVPECAGLYEMIIFGSIVLSYPTGIRNKIYGIIFGITIIYILNMLRLLSISYILIYHIDKFNFVDKYLWQISLVVFISLTYTIWLKYISKTSEIIGQPSSLLL